MSDEPGSSQVCTNSASAGSGNELASLGALRSTAGTNCEHVRVDTLDNFTRSQLSATTRLQLIKIDAEGFDGRVLLGARTLLRQRRVDAVIFECCHLWHVAKLPQGAFDDALTPSTGVALKLAAPFASLVRAASGWGYDTFLIGDRNLLWLSPYNDSALNTFERLCAQTFCNFALVRATPALRKIPSLVNLDMAVIPFPS